MLVGVRTHDAADPTTTAAGGVPANYDQLLHPEHYAPTLDRLKKALPRIANEKLIDESNAWLQRADSDMNAWLEARKRDDHELAVRMNEEKDLDAWLQQRRHAEHAVEVHSSRFQTDAPLAYNLYFPPPAPWPPGDSLHSVLKLIPGHLRDEEGVDLLIAEGLRLDALNHFLLREQKDALATPQWDYNFLIKQAESGGLGVTYGEIKPTGKETAKQKQEREKAQEELGKRDRKNRKKKGLEYVGTNAFDPIPFEKLLTIIEMMEQARDAERNAGLAAAGISRAFRR